MKIFTFLFFPDKIILLLVFILSFSAGSRERESAPMCKDYCVIFNTWEGEYHGFIMNILCHYSPFHLSLVGPTVKLKWIIWKQISQMSNSTLKIRFLCSSCSVALCCFILNGLIYYIGTNNLDIQHRYENILLGPHPTEQIKNKTFSLIKPEMF